MKILNALAGSMLAASLMAAPAVFAAEPMMKAGPMMKVDSTVKHDMGAFLKACDMNHDGMMSKAEMMSHMEMMFDKIDVKKTGKLDSKQTEAFQKEFNKGSFGS